MTSQQPQVVFAYGGDLTGSGRFAGARRECLGGKSGL
jgi:hypothetical protein